MNSALRYRFDGRASPSSRGGKAGLYSLGGRLWRVFLRLLQSALGWVLISPLTLLVRRDRRLVVVYGRDGGKFLDNAKYFYAHAARRRDKSLRFVFLGKDRALQQALRLAGGCCSVVGTIDALWLWLRAGTIVVDSTDWSDWLRLPAAKGARLVQLWHGIPLKLVQLARVKDPIGPRSKAYALAYRAFVYFVGRCTRYDWLLSTSRFVTEAAFERSFNYLNVSHAGYPRNDVLFQAADALTRINVDESAETIVRLHRESCKGKVGIFAPTFRESLRSPFGPDAVDLERMSEAASRLHMLILVKLHPWMYARVEGTTRPGLFFVSPESDVYPLLVQSDFLITDYSSIYFDYLLLNKPIVFFSYDLSRYLEQERRMYFCYEEMTPGPKVTTNKELGLALEELACDVDNWQVERSRVRELVFDAPDGRAAERLMRDLFPPSCR